MKFESIEQLKEYLKENDLLGLDSEFSPFMQRLKKQFNADDIHINRWWVMTSKSWKCPVCERGKEQIVRLNKHNHLSGQLHEHHDHIKDLVEKEFNKVSSLRKDVIADELSQKFVTRLAFGLTAYDNIIVCSDCNHADKEAKKIAKTHKDFSFAPSDIAQFIIIENNKEHKINSEIAIRVWKEQETIFNKRMKLINYIATLASENSHWYKPSKNTVKKTEWGAENIIRSYGLRDLKYYPAEQLLYTPKKYKKNNNSWRTEKTIKKYIPTDGEVQHLININGSYWNNLDNDWTCPSCNRTKRDCIQKSKKGKLTFISIKKDFFNSSFNNWVETIIICNECHTTCNNLQKEIDELNQLPYNAKIISFKELRSIIYPNKNTGHTIINSIVEKLLPTLFERFEHDLYTYSYLSPK